MTITYVGLAAALLDDIRLRGVDHLGNPVDPFVDEEGEWPLRCCLTDSVVGEELAIVNVSPFPWTSPYRTSGPVVIHASACAGSDGSFPRQFETRAQILRAYGRDGDRDKTLVYDLNTLVDAGAGLDATVRTVLADPRVEFAVAHNVLSGCYSFTALRAGLT